jgi:5-methylcytosine-specific restriction endonuclease McrA
MNKKCKKCELELDVSNFPKNGKYYGSYCKPCNRALMNERAYYKKDSHQTKRSEYKEKNKDKLKDWHHQNYINNKEKLLEQSKQGYQKNKQSVCNRTKKYREENADWYREYKRQWRNLPNNKLRGNMSRGVWGCLKGKQKNCNTMKYVGCTIEELWEHLKQQFKGGMTVENYGEWHVDHIIPLANFDFSENIEENLKKAWHYSNLQPLWKNDNLSKGKRLTKLND